ncbi:putative amidase C869.01 [Trichoderma asperellum]|uniref:Putative amidase C869.01 n=1 Tax=Trichoderma asperellum TaxID=101201 RepID=A0A6V8R4G1_TRIAP|nr:putative amidase C869.01 [Trichoderma asperellum]
MSSLSFNVLTANAVDLQRLLAENKITSVEIVQKYFEQIDRHEPVLNAFISAAPRDKVLSAAAALDEERKNGKIRSAFHGIPIVLKDSFITAADLGMSTTLGSWAFVGAKAAKNSAIAQILIDAGLIILGKGNMTEFAGMKMTTIMSGWSSHGGQTLSPYVGKIEENETLIGHSAPGGSSTGSAVAVAAGFSPLAMGTETVGSIVTPSTRAGLYALKITYGALDTTGLYALSDFFDCAGPMAKSAADVRLMAEILLKRTFDSTCFGTWEGLSVGFLDPRAWTISEEMCPQHEGTAEQMVEEYEAVVELLKKSGCALKYPAEIASVEELTVDGEPAITPIACKSVEDIVKFNRENSEKAMPPPYTEQNDLEKSLTYNDEPEKIESLKSRFRPIGQQIINNAFDTQGLNIIAAPGDSSLCIHAAAAGYPIATAPVGQLRYNGRPFGLSFLARANDEESLVRFMAAYEAVAAPRPVPNI